MYLCGMKGGATNRQLYVPTGSAVRNTIDREKDIWWVVAEVAKGRTYASIAEELNQRNEYNLSPDMIRRDVNDVMVEWKRENMENIDAYIAKELLRLEELEKIVMENFENSKTLRPNEYAQLVKRGYTIEEIDEMYVTRPLAGDPRYIDTLLKLQGQRLRLLGLDKGNDVAQNTIVQYNFNGVDMDELAGIADLLQDKKMKELTIDNQ